MSLGNPEEQTPLSITDSAQEYQLTHGIQSIEFQNLGNNDIYFGKLSTLTSARGGVIYAGSYKSFENVGAGWKVSFICASIKTSNLRVIQYK
jgi:hypothetical protein